MMFEIVGGSIRKIVIDDEVRFADKYMRTKTAQMENTHMIVTETSEKGEDGVVGPLTLYNSQNCQFVEAELCVLEMVPLLESAGKSIELSKQVTNNLV